MCYPIVRITAGDPSLIADLKELWKYRELLGFLVWRDIAVRYKQTVLGIAWAILQPLLTAFVFTLFFGRLAGVPSDGVPYPLFAYIALVPWTLFASGVAQSSGSIVASENLITKTYFPRMLIPLSAVLSGLVAFAINMIFCAAMLLWYGEQVRWRVLWILPLTLLAIVATFGVGLIFSSLNVRYRDIHHLLPFVLQIWMFATPIAYSAALVKGLSSSIYALNPMVGVVEGFRWALLGHRSPGPTLLISTCVAIAVLGAGFVHFRRQQREFADFI